MSLQVHRVTNQRRAARLGAYDPATYELPFYFPSNVATEVVLPVMVHGVSHEFAKNAIGSWLDNYQGLVKKGKKITRFLLNYSLLIP
jgi:hypothetical protein